MTKQIMIVGVGGQERCLPAESWATLSQMPVMMSKFLKYTV